MTRPTDLDDQLDDALAPDAPDVLAWLDAAAYSAEEDEGPPEWEIDGQRTAEWALRRLRRSTGERDDARELASELRAQADAYEEAVARRTERDIAFFEGRLRAFHDRLLLENPKRKTVELPSAKLERRAGGVSVIVEDEDVLRAWAEEHDDELLDYKDPAILKTPLKSKYGGKVSAEAGAYPAVSDVTGEVLPGVKIVRGEASEKISWTSTTPVDEETVEKIGMAEARARREDAEDEA